MKKILSLVMTLAAVAAVHAQGTFNSATYTGDPNGTHSSGVIEDYTVINAAGPTGHGLAFGGAYQAQYYIGAAGISGSAGFGNTIPSGMSPVGSASTSFLGSSSGDAAGGAGYFDNGTVNTSVAGGSTVSLMLFAWKGSTGTLAASTVNGHSAIYQFILGGAGSPAGPPTSWSQNLGGGVVEPTLANFGINTVPEPATITLALMGAGALFIRRRKV